MARRAALVFLATASPAILLSFAFGTAPRRDELDADVAALMEMQPFRRPVPPDRKGAGPARADPPNHPPGW